MEHLSVVENSADCNQGPAAATEKSEMTLILTMALNVNNSGESSRGFHR